MSWFKINYLILRKWFLILRKLFYLVLTKWCLILRWWLLIEKKENYVILRTFILFYEMVSYFKKTCLIVSAVVLTFCHLGKIIYFVDYILWFKVYMKYISNLRTLVYNFSIYIIVTEVECVSQGDVTLCYLSCTCPRVLLPQKLQAKFVTFVTSKVSYVKIKKLAINQ